PNKQGFDYFFGYLCQRHAHNYYPEFLFRNDQRVPLKNKVAGDRADGAGVATEKVEYSYDLMAAESLQFVEANKEGPFFLYLAITIPHANNEAGNKGMEVPSLGQYADLDWPEPQKGHAAMISLLDADVGRLLAKLKELGIDDNTLVLFTSDNGPHREGGNDPMFNDSNGPLRGIKRDLYDGGIRVPMIARWPGKIAPGTTTDLISAFWDFLPTACELAGIDAPRGIDGISYLPTLLGENTRQKKHDYLYWEYSGLKAVRMGQYKAVGFPRGSRFEVYDLKADLGETTNIAADNPKLVEQLTKCMEEAHVDSPDFK
ncbi:MAG TPA: sulfatase-like hydrolase/transferase, partial [Thermoguttaceae bacterium]|nr:sulfatase-like hydrolase/transferase [Thermoguttaceae bacterium]